MKRFLMGLVVVTGLTILTAADAKAQAAVAIGNPLTGRIYVNSAARAYGIVPVVRRVVSVRYGHRYAPRAHVARRYYGGYAQRYHHYGYRHHHRGYGFRR